MLAKNGDVTRLIRKGNVIWEYDSDEMEMELKHYRKALLKIALVEGNLPLNKAYEFLQLRKSREGLTTGWDFDLTMKPEDLFTWAFRSDHEVEVTFHNLKYIVNLYKTEEELE